ncbi:MAG: EAL domain-containing protein [Sphingomonadales bacterium]
MLLAKYVGNKNAKRHWPLWGIVCGGALLSAVVAAVLYQEEYHLAQEEGRARFVEQAQERVAALEKVIATRLGVLHALHALYDTIPGGRVSRKAFHDFASHLLRQYPSIQALEWIPRIADSQRAAYEAQARADFPDFRIRDRLEQGRMQASPTRKEYFPVYFVEPYRGNEIALGFDLASNPTRLAALNRSRDGGKMRISGRITLVQETGKQFGFLAYHPIYTEGKPLTTPEERRRRLIGFALGVFRVGDLVDAAMGTSDTRAIDLWLFDESASGASRFLHSHTSLSRERDRQSFTPPPERSLQHRAVIQVAGRRWSVVIVSAPSQFTSKVSAVPLISLLGGWLITGLLAIYFHSLRRAARNMLAANQALQEQIGKRKHFENKLVNLAHRDTLTGLPNRLLLEKRFLQAIRGEDGRSAWVAVLFLDLDRFKHVNDGLGHPLGDEMLRVMARRLSACVRDCDTVARWGGDEFVMLIRLDLATGESALSKFLRRILDEVHQPLQLDQHRVTVSCSIGASFYPRHGKDLMTLLKNADTALYQVKDGGRNGYQYYEGARNNRSLQRLKLENELHQALERDEFELFYQPQVTLKTGQIQGIEALIRWHSPSRGLVLPAEFIPLAEETGLILPIGAWVLRSACAQIKAWRQMDMCDLVIAVNLSPRQFQDEALLGMIEGLLKQTGLKGQSLMLEITEHVMMTQSYRTLPVMEALRERGVRFAIDDFGTGYSSLSYLKRYPIDQLKIDQSFVADVTTSADSAAIVEAIIAMAHSLGLKVVAEGAETPAQLHFLQSRHCDEVQGRCFSPPLPAGKATQFLRNRFRHKEISLGERWLEQVTG